MPDPTPEPTTTTHGHVSIEATRNPSQDAYEALMELLLRIGVTPSHARVDWAGDEHTAPILIGRLGVTDVLRLNRALRVALGQSNPPSVLADRPHRPLTGETVLDTATDGMGEVVGYLLRPLEPGEPPWTADPDDIRRPERDRLIRARMARLDLDRRTNPPPSSALVPAPPQGLGRG
ncbi:hypothetical protein ABZX40_19740 [Streptomyces sp. NPDC004610]|uniref:hypothetical protein n=1 Tax=unclassified Streptomyces TaxID=2593676 RepID=UPI0033AF10F8